MKWFVLVLLLLCFLASSEACRIVPTPPQEPDVVRPVPPQLQKITVRSHNVDVTIQDGVATTVLETVFFNPNARVLEGTYLFPLPKGASVSQFSMWIDGKEMKGELLDAKKAKDLYVSIVQRMIDPGLLEFVGRETFKMQIYPIPANGEKKVKLTYQHVLPADGNLRSYVYPLTTVGNGREDTLGKVNFRVNISSQVPIKSVFSPSHKVTTTKEENKSTVSWEEENAKPDRDFTLYISSSDQKIDLSFVPFSKGGGKGHFLMMLSPEVKTEERVAKDMLFVFDTSGSMLDGNRIDQAKAALRYCLKSLSAQDRFNILTFSTTVRRYDKTNDFIPATKENKEAALQFVEEKIYASGGTNIEEALTTALGIADPSVKRPTMIFFLTDGRPTVGITDTESIVENIKKANKAKKRLFTFGVGVDLNTKLLDLLTEQNFGAQEYVSPKEDIEVKVSSLFDKVASPVLTEVEISFPSLKDLQITEVYPKNFPDLFKGSQVTFLGKYSGTGDQAVKLTGFNGDKKEEFVYEVKFPDKNVENSQIPRVWATRKIGFLLDQIRLEGESASLKQEIVALAEEYGIVTPYTSYLVLEDDARIIRQQPSSSPPAPSSQVWRESVSRSDPSTRSMEKAKDSMKAESGEDAVATSQWIKGQKEAEIAYESKKADKAGSSSLEKSMKKIDDKTFYLRGDVWYDSLYKEKGKEKRIKLQYMSKEYLSLLSDKPEIAKYLAIAPQVVLVWEDKVYEIVQK